MRYLSVVLDVVYKLSVAHSCRAVLVFIHRQCALLVNTVVLYYCRGPACLLFLAYLTLLFRKIGGHFHSAISLLYLTRISKPVLVCRKYSKPKPYAQDGLRSCFWSRKKKTDLVHFRIVFRIHKSRPNDLIVLHPLGIFILFFSFLVRKIPFAGIELTSQRVRGLRGTSELPGVLYEDYYYVSVQYNGFPPILLYC